MELNEILKQGIDEVNKRAKSDPSVKDVLQQYDGRRVIINIVDDTVYALLITSEVVSLETSESANPEDMYLEMESETIKNPGLENILKAEKRYERRKQIVDKPRVYRKGTKSEIKKKSTKKKPETDSKKSRIGSIPVEESIYKERIKLKSASSKQKDSGKEEKVTTFLCPSCGSKELYYEAGLISGYKYHCKDCDYIGSFVIEKDFKVNE